MEQNFYRDEFEQMLRETTDEFRMQPPRKVWHSIYNNFHPDRKWPSLAVSLMLLTAILFIGVSNNNSINKVRTTLTSSISNRSLLAHNQLIYQPATIAIRTNQDTKIPYPVPEPVIQISTNDRQEKNLQQGSTTSTETNQLFTNVVNIAADITVQKTLSVTTVLRADHTHQNNPFVSANNIRAASDHLSIAKSSEINTSYSNEAAIHTNNIGEAVLTNATSEIERVNSSNISAIDDTKKTQYSLNIIPIEDKAWIEDYAFHHKKNSSKWKNKLSMQFYITPSIGYRTRFKNNDFEPSLGLLQRTSPGGSLETVSQQAVINIEAGAGLISQISKRFRLKAGLQFNYSNYITYAHLLQHPVQTTVLLNDINTGSLMPVSYSSNYGNVLGENNSQLNNKSVQLSIPFGMDYKLMGNGKVSWYAGATIQPGIVLNGTSYLVSADYKHFAEDNSLLRSFNVNSAIETFVSIKAPSGTLINLGPQLRYQLMSTHTKQYSYTEKLYNIGFKIGITKKL
ncbi:MAG: hypothetical protein WD135_04285 [Ferruginibacter sp.]